MLQTGTLAFLGGILLLHQCVVLPPMWWWYFLPIATAILIIPRKRWLKLLGCFLTGFLWAQLQAHSLLQQQLPAELINQNISVIGYVASLPERQAGRLRFEFEIIETTEPRLTQYPKKVRLNWYESTPVILRPGEKWQLTLRLRPPHNFTNPGSFDYSAWLLQRGMVATGSVSNKAKNTYLDFNMLRNPVQSLRFHFQSYLRTAMATTSGAGLLTALLIGERSGITETEWTVLQQTGTTHLMAISGLHIGLVAGFVFVLMLHLWRFLPRASLLLPAPKAAAIMAWLAALMYAAMAGFAIPTQRALIMLAVILLSVFLQRTHKSSQVLAVALLLILLWDPFAVLSASFWLSFCAVALIFYLLQNQPLRTARWTRWWRMQWAISLGLLPIVIIFFQQAPLLSPFTNLVAIPWVSMIVLPLAMLSTLVSIASETLAVWGLQLSANLMHYLLNVLAWTASFKSSLYYLPAPDFVILSLALIGIGVWLLPSAIPARFLGLLLCLPIFFPLLKRPVEGEIHFSLLDVGQGLAAVVQTAQHTLVFDTGPRFSVTFDTGDAVILPFLRQQHVKAIDTLFVSHSDTDHIGGAQSLLSAMPVRQIISSVPDLRRGPQDLGCLAGQHWRWDHVEFTVLYPSHTELAEASKDNERSCVLHVKTATQQILITGDIEHGAERKLVERYGEKLRSSVLVVAHHGSKTSSTSSFLDTVRPQVALIPAGWHNRFGMPAKVVVERLEHRRLSILNTASDGAIQIVTGPTLQVQRHREANQRYWHAW